MDMQGQIYLETVQTIKLQVLPGFQRTKMSIILALVHYSSKLWESSKL